MTRFEKLLWAVRKQEEWMSSVESAPITALREVVEHLAEIMAVELQWMGKSKAANQLNLSAKYKEASK